MMRNVCFFRLSETIFLELLGQKIRKPGAFSRFPGCFQATVCVGAAGLNEEPLPEGVPFIW